VLTRFQAQPKASPPHQIPPGIHRLFQRKWVRPVHDIPALLLQVGEDFDRRVGVAPTVGLKEVERGDDDEPAAGFQYPRPLVEGDEGFGQAVNEEGVEEDIEGGVGEGEFF